MLTPDVITDTITEWAQGLDYEYMLLHTMICYGLFYSKNLEWVVTKLGGIYPAIWKVGLLLALTEIGRIIPFIDDKSVYRTAAIVQKSISIIHSYIVIQIFVEDIVITINKWVTIIKKMRKSNDDN